MRDPFEYPLFVIQARIKPSATQTDSRWKMVEGGSAHGLVFAANADVAALVFGEYIAAQNWEVTHVGTCQETDPSLTKGRPKLEALLQRARKDGVAGEIVPAAFASDPGPAH